jgi:hypothetical protein
VKSARNRSSTALPSAPAARSSTSFGRSPAIAAVPPARTLETTVPAPREERTNVCSVALLVRHPPLSPFLLSPLPSCPDQAKQEHSVQRQVAQSQRRCGRDEPSPGARCGRDEPSPGADVARVSRALMRMWHGWRASLPHHRARAGAAAARRRRRG